MNDNLNNLIGLISGEREVPVEKIMESLSNANTNELGEKKI